MLTEWHRLVYFASQHDLNKCTLHSNLVISEKEKHETLKRHTLFFVIKNVFPARPDCYISVTNKSWTIVLFSIQGNFQWTEHSNECQP